MTEQPTSEPDKKPKVSKGKAFGAGIAATALALAAGIGIHYGADKPITSERVESAGAPSPDRKPVETATPVEPALQTAADQATLQAEAEKQAATVAAEQAAEQTAEATAQAGLPVETLQ